MFCHCFVDGILHELLDFVVGAGAAASREAGAPVRVPTHLNPLDMPPGGSGSTQPPLDKKEKESGDESTATTAINPLCEPSSATTTRRHAATALRPTAKVGNALTSPYERQRHLVSPAIHTPSLCVTTSPTHPTAPTTSHHANDHPTAPTSGCYTNVHPTAPNDQCANIHPTAPTVGNHANHHPTAPIGNHANDSSASSSSWARSGLFLPPGQELSPHQSSAPPSASSYSRAAVSSSAQDVATCSAKALASSSAQG